MLNIKSIKVCFAQTIYFPNKSDHDDNGFHTYSLTVCKDGCIVAIKYTPDKWVHTSLIHILLKMSKGYKYEFSMH